MEKSPYSINAEQAILGAMLLDIEVAGKVINDFNVKKEHFWRPEHGELYAVLKKGYAKQRPLDLVTLPEEVMTQGVTQKVGGIGYICSLPDKVTSTANIEYYCEILTKHHARRELAKAMKTASQEVINAEEPRRVADRVVGQIISMESVKKGRAWKRYDQVLDEAVEEIEEAIANPGEAGGYKTGFRDLDYRLGNLHPNDLIILAGRPGMGKTALALNIIENIATQTTHDKIVGLISLEMQDKQVGKRTLAGASGVSGRNMRTGLLTPKEQEAMRASHKRLAGKLKRFFVCDQKSLTITELVSQAHQLRATEGELALLVIDYLQLLSDELGNKHSREREVANMSRQAKIMAGQLNCPVLLLSQLNRTVESRKTKRPEMGDLRESGAIEQDADAILFVFRGEYYWPDKMEYKNKAEVIIAKSRHGKPGVVDLNFIPNQTKFSSFTSEQLKKGARYEKK